MGGQLVIFEIDDAGRIVTAIFKLFQPFKQNGDNPPFSGVTDNAAHDLLLKDIEH